MWIQISILSYILGIIQAILNPRSFSICIIEAEFLGNCRNMPYTFLFSRISPLFLVYFYLRTHFPMVYLIYLLLVAILKVR